MVNRTVEVRVEDRLGTGAFGSVYKAQILGGVHQHKVCAAKELKNSGYDNFLQELLPLSQVWSKPHPHIVSFYGYGRRQGHEPKSGCEHLLLMEWVPGRSLRDELNERVGSCLRFEEENALEIIRQLLEALDHLHNNLQIIHRDVKPDNILLNAQGNVKLGDFGVATLGTSSTQRGVGSVRYMAPEVAQKGIEHTGKADIYSAGCTLVEMLGLRLELRLKIVEEGRLAEGVPTETTILYWKSKANGRYRIEVQLPQVQTPALETMMTDMISDDPAHRPDTTELLAACGVVARRRPQHPQRSLRCISDLSVASTAHASSQLSSASAAPPPSPPTAAVGRQDATGAAEHRAQLGFLLPSRTVLALCLLLAQIALLALAFFLGGAAEKQRSFAASLLESSAPASSSSSSSAAASAAGMWHDADQDLIPDCAEQFISDAGEALTDATEAVLESSGLPLMVWSSMRDRGGKDGSGGKLRADLLDVLAMAAFSGTTMAAVVGPLHAALNTALSPSSWFRERSTLAVQYSQA